MVYHTLDHTRFVVEMAELIGKESGLSEEEIDIARIGAWFHDIGYASAPDKHESVGADMAVEFLASKDVDEEIIKTIKGCILATRIPQNPDDTISAVVCDADLYHLSSDDYYEYANLLREESKVIKGLEFSKLEFDKLSVMFFMQHQYHTEYGKTVLQKGKDKNFESLKENIDKKSVKREKELKKLNKEIDSLQSKLEKKKGYSRGVESMFRLTARNQINLSAIADNKSNILITVNTLILTIVLTVLVSRFEEYPNLILPSLIFMTTSLTTIILAILSTRPHISSGKFTEHDIKQKSVNLLFFGNFYNMELDEYDWALREMMKEDDYLYSTMIKDQYALGKVLAKKYKLIRASFNFFMFGLIITVIAFVLSFLNF